MDTLDAAATLAAAVATLAAPASSIAGERRSKLDVWFATRGCGAVCGVA
jgi:hypothetical protein